MSMQTRVICFVIAVVPMLFVRLTAGIE